MSALCPREDELLDAMGRGFIGEELTAHVVTCESCTELQTVAGALLDERVDAVSEAHVPSSGTMLFRMQMRHRHEAQSAARRSLLIGQAVTLVVAIGLVITFFGADVAVEMKQVAAAFNVSTKMLIVLAAWALMLPIGGWLAVRQK